MITYRSTDARRGIRGAARLVCTVAFVAVLGMIVSIAPSSAAPSAAPGVAALPAEAPATDYTPVPAARLLETRSGSSTVDGQSNGVGAFGAGSTKNVVVAGRGQVPANGAGIAVLTVTALSPSGPSFVTAWPTGAQRPTASNLNLVAGQSVTNTVVVALGTGGAVSLYNLSGTTNMVVDVVGWYASTTSTVIAPPRRLMDTRAGEPTFDGQAAGAGAVGAGQTRDLQVDGRAFTATPAGSSVLVNVTAVNPTGSTFITVWPSGRARPTASNLNLVPRQILPNLVLVPVGDNGRISLYNLTGTTDLVVDLEAVIPAGASTTSLQPARLLDTRAGSPTVDQQQSGTGAVGAGQTRSLPVLNRGGVPASGVSAVVVNITAVQPTAATTISSWPNGGTRPPDPNLTVARNEIRPGLAVVAVGTNGAIQLYNQAGSADLVVDVLGWIQGGTVVTPPGGGTLTWSSNFTATNNFSQFKSTPYNYQYVGAPTIVNSPTTAGQRAAQFRVPGGTRPESRQEIEPNVTNFVEGSEHWFGFSFTLPTTFPVNETSWQVLTQWKNDGTGSPPVELKVGNGQIKLDGGYGHPQQPEGSLYWSQDVAPANLGQRIDMVVHIKFSRDPATSVIDVWKDGVQRVSGYHPRGGTLYPSYTTAAASPAQARAQAAAEATAPQPTDAPTEPALPNTMVAQVQAAGSLSSYWKMGMYRDPAITSTAQYVIESARFGTGYGAVAG